MGKSQEIENSYIFSQLLKGKDEPKENVGGPWIWKDDVPIASFIRWMMSVSLTAKVDLIVSTCWFYCEK